MNLITSRFNGVNIVVSSMIKEFTPVLELKHNVEVTDAFRQAFNKYLLDTFGSARTVTMMGNTTVVHPNTYRLLQKEVKQNEDNS